MPRARSIPLLAMLALMLAIPARPASEPTSWLEVHSSHFTVITDAGEKKGREVAFRFEQMRSVFASLLGKERLNQPVPLTILAFKNDKTYYQAAPLRFGPTGEAQPIEFPGVFIPGEDQHFILLNLFEDEPWRAVAHDFAHMLLNYNYPPAQGWFDEGLAEYFASIRVDNRQVEIGGDPELQPSVTENLLGAEKETNPPQSLTELLGAQVWLSIPDLFAMKHDTFQFDQGKFAEGTHHTLYYAESWMVMHYLLHEKKLPETGTYFGLVLNQHMPIEQAIQQAYGMSSLQLEQAVKDYFHAQAALITALDNARKIADSDHPANTTNPEQAYRFPTPIAPDDSAITATPLPEADARAIYAGVQVRLPERREMGLKALQTLATTTTPTDVKQAAKAEQQAKRTEQRADQDETLLPTTAIGNEVAHRMLAWDHIERGEFDDAITELGDAAALNQRDMWVRYYLSIVKFRSAQAKHAEIQGLPNMMIDLRTVLEWYPELADAYDLLAVARYEGGTPTAAMQAERAAMNLRPRDQIYVYHLAQVYIAAKNWEAAEALLNRLKASDNPKVADLARQRLDQVASERKYGMAGATTTTPPKFEKQKSPFDVLEEDAAKRAATEKTGEPGAPIDARMTKFFKGRLVAVDCSQSPAAILTITAEGVVLKLRATDYKSLLLIGANDFSCAWKDRQVSVNYKPGGLADGDLVSLEVR
jgi:tetratricopeptide (TPR) repeat protein